MYKIIHLQEKIKNNLYNNVSNKIQTAQDQHYEFKYHFREQNHE